MCHNLRFPSIALDKIKWSLTTKFSVDDNDSIQNIIGTDQLVIDSTMCYYT